MSTYPFRLLAIGYGFAGLCAAALWLGGGGALAAGLTFWIGGAAAVLAAAALMTRGMDTASMAHDDDVVRDDEMARWERDRRLDQRPAGDDAVGAAHQTG